MSGRALWRLNTGHGGSLTTVHANNAESALSSLATCAMQGGGDLPWEVTCRGVVDGIALVIHMTRADGRRFVEEAAFVNGYEAGGNTWDITRLYGAPGFLGHGLGENPMSKEVGDMVQSKRVQGAVSARTEGARRASGVGADGAAVGAGALAPGQRWSASRKRDVVLRLLRGESLDTVSRAVGVELYRLEAWQARALAGLELGLKAQAGEPLAAELDAAKRHIGELSMEIELLRERARAAECRLPLATRRSRR